MYDGCDKDFSVSRAYFCGKNLLLAWFLENHPFGILTQGITKSILLVRGAREEIKKPVCINLAKQPGALRGQNSLQDLQICSLRPGSQQTSTHSWWLTLDTGKYRKPPPTYAPQWLGVKESACNTRDTGSISGSGGSPGGGNGNPLQYSCLENPMDRGAWWATVHGVPKSQTRLSNWTHAWKQGRALRKSHSAHSSVGMSTHLGWANCRKSSNFINLK